MSPERLYARMKGQHWYWIDYGPVSAEAIAFGQEVARRLGLYVPDKG